MSSKKLLELNKQRVLTATLATGLTLSVMAPSSAQASWFRNIMGGSSNAASASTAQTSAPAPVAAAPSAPVANPAAAPAAAPVVPPVAPKPVICENIMTPPPPEMAQRAAMTNPSQSKSYSKTSGAREQAIESRRAWQQDFILNFTGEYGRGDIPPLYFFPEQGVQVQTLSQANGLGKVITRIVVKGSDPVLRGTLLLPVSGHNGNDNARRWAKTDTYSVKLDTLPQSQRTGGPFTWSNPRNEVYLVKHVKSLDLVTLQEIEIPLNPDPNGSVLVLYYRDGSAGPGGYIEGRIMEVFWDKTP